MKDFLSNPWMSGCVVGLLAIGGMIYHSGQLADRVDHLEDWRRTYEERTLTIDKDVQELQVTTENIVTRVGHMEVVLEKLDGKLDTLVVAVARLDRKLALEE